MPEDQDTKDSLSFNRKPVKYDTTEILSFLRLVFHAPADDDEEVFVQISPRAPAGFGSTPRAALTDKLDRTSAPMPAYYSTSTLSLADDGTFRHTKTAFKSYRVLVLDDIGTKIPWDSIPEALEPSYIIESSPGNFQLGYVLQEPIRDYAEAQALINLFVGAGYTDGGGAMPVKKVRLPCGVNGKPGEKGAFHVRLKKAEPIYWTPQALIDAAGIDADWEEHRKIIETQSYKTRRYGASAWIPGLFHVDPQTGVYDPVLEFMYSQGRVIQDGQERFMDVICPFHEDHSEQDLRSKLCGYSPLGHGMYPHKRVFSCFHDSCRAHTTRDFLQRVHLLGGPLMPSHEHRPENVVNMVYDTVHDRVYDLREEGVMYPRHIQVINRITPKVPIPDGKGGEKLVDQLPLWLKQPSCVKVAGPVYDASKRSRLVRDQQNQLRVNLFNAVEYEKVTPDPEHVAMFTEFMSYLIPNPEEREYIIKWLACKVQHPTFRGAALVLVSQAQGTGKNTLMKMIDRLFGGNQTRAVAMEDLLAPGGFNEWVMAQFVNVNESLATNDLRTSRRAYNRLKELVDPAPMPMTANPKYGTKVEVMCTTSFLFFSNHMDAVYLHEGDRRFYGAKGPDEPASADYFDKVYTWMGGDGWMQHVWWYLMGVDVKLSEMMAPPPMTETMREIRYESTSPLEAVVTGAIACWPTPLVPVAVMKELLVQYVPRGLPDNYRPIAQRMFTDKLRSCNTLTDIARINKVRMSVKPDFIRKVNDAAWRQRARRETQEAMKNYDEVRFKQRLDDWLEDKGYEF